MPQTIQAEIPDLDHCEVCGAATDDIHCKVICPNCGYTRDCSDP